MVNPEPSTEAYKKFTMVRVEALDHAIKGLPRDRIAVSFVLGKLAWVRISPTSRCARSVDVMLAIDVQAYSFEAANVRHEHEWRVWSGYQAGARENPGAGDRQPRHQRRLRYPELVADRIVRYAGLVGRENVIASTDCGLGGGCIRISQGRNYMTLAQGAELATKQLWR